MNTDDLRKAIFDCGMSEVDAMNLLQDQGVISDLCVWVADVAEADIPKAIHLLEHYADTRKPIPRRAR